MKSYTAYIFDFDGTLCDTAPDIIKSVELALVDNGYDASLAVKYRIGPPLAEMLKSVLSDADNPPINNIVVSFRKHYNASALEQSKPFDGVRNALLTLDSQGFPLFIATNKPSLFTEKILSEQGLDIFFKEVVCADHISERVLKKPEMIAYILQTHQLDPADTLMVGDSAEDVGGGKAMGTATCAVLYGYGNPTTLLAACPDYTAVAFSDILP